MVNKEEFRKYAVKGRRLGSRLVDDYLHRVENMTRSVIEERPMNFREVDVFSRLMADRIIFLGMAIDDNLANVIVAQLLFLESADPKKDIVLYINSPGGSVYAGLGVYDTMQYIRPDVATICTSFAASMGAVLLCGGAAGKRSALQHARVMIHQPSGGAQGQSSDIEISVKQIVVIRQELYQIIARHSKQSYEQVEKDSDRDYFMKAEEAKAYGMIDEVFTRE
ncbi:MAG: ATP-dependent Clp protease proteolytic subunit [Ferruginibacter sp.]|nr:ATP-dependent Clp protease proteolytic subunit [Cytophagales bacterium]